MLNYDTKHIVILNEIDDEFKAYLLGFLYADGCITKIRSGWLLEVNLARKDETHLWKLNYIISQGRNKTFKRQSGKYESVRLLTSNQRFCNELIHYGIIPNKSLILKPPTCVPDNLLRHFIRGYFDGDGCITFNNHRMYKEPHLIAKLVGTEAVLSFIKNWFKKQGNLSSKALPFKEKNLWRLCYGGKIAKRFISLLYTDANIFLDRKYILAEAYI